MERNVDICGIKLSNICFGCADFGYGIDEKTAFSLLDAFYDRGGNVLDTANVYCKWIDGKNGSENMLGKYLKSRGKNRFVIMSKGGHFSFSEPQKSRVNYECLEKDVDESLNTLGLSCIPFYWLHRDNSDLSVEEILFACEKLKKQGKILHYGASNWTTDRLMEAKKVSCQMGYEGFFGLSNSFSAACENKGVIGGIGMEMVDGEQFEWLRANKFPLIPYSASAKGFFGKRLENGKPFLPQEQKVYNNAESERRFRILLKIHNDYNLPISSCAVAALLSQDFPIIPILATKSEKHLDEMFIGAEAVLDKHLFDDMNFDLKRKTEN